MDTAPYTVTATDAHTSARCGVLHTAQGDVQTPVFMPVGTRGTVKAVTTNVLSELGAQILLGNAYHLSLRPGVDLIARAGGLHAFMNWQRPLLTDSGGFQIFSLGDTFAIDEDGVSFRSIIDGQAHRWTPEENMRIQELIGADIIMQLDVCCGYPATRDEVTSAMERSLAWAARCKAAHTRADQLLFGIVQGGMHLDLRLASLAGLAEIGFPGYGIGRLQRR